MSIPNLITLARILLVPVMVWAITAGEMKIAFFLFLLAGLSDLVEAYRCTACGGEFRQRNHGPIVSLETWDAGADFPEARIHRE